ncbi:MAG: hypothetical protein IPJ82_03150 [Lewinellaceae bacterium]|nr:hypothetical protein [Lewinellaceae bacterium]
MIRNILEEKYGAYITNQFLNDRNEVIRENLNVDGVEEQQEVIRVLKSLKDINGNSLVPDKFWNNPVDWGLDFSSWIGNFDNKDLFFVGAEPHVYNNYQLVYDFGNYRGKDLTETAKEHFNRESDIWHYLTKIFVEDMTDSNITAFLSRCYITDLCHIVPKYCGQVKDICKKLSISASDWKVCRTAVAQRFLLKEIEAVNPEFVILHGNPSREFFCKELGLNFTGVCPIEDSKFTIQTGKLNGYKVISIPHLKGDVRNKLWICKKYPGRPESAKRILNGLIDNPQVCISAYATCS